MKFYRFGDESNPVMLVFPGTCCSWKSMKGVVPVLTDTFQVVIVSYDGFEETQPDTVFRSMYEECEHIEHYVQEKFGGKVFAAYGCSLGGSFVGLLVQRRNIHIDHGFIGSSDMDQANAAAAKIQSGILCPLLEKWVKNGKMPDKIADMKRKKEAAAGTDPAETEKTIEFFNGYLAGAQCATKGSIYNQFYSDLITPLEDNISVDGTTIHVFYALKMGEKYFDRYEQHFYDADIVARDYGHEELVMNYPEQWAQDIKRCCGLPYDSEKALPEAMSYRRDRKRFFRDHSYKEADVNGVKFKYLDCGSENASNGKTLVFLVGGLGVSELYFPYMSRLESEYRTITFDFPYEYSTIDSLADGIIGLLDVLGIEKAIWAGSSFGGYLAQALAIKYPEHTEALCLMSTAAISEKTIGTLKGKYQKLVPLALKAMEKMPFSMTKKREFNSCMKHITEATNEERFYMRELFTDIYKDITKEFDLHMTKLVADVINLTPCTAKDFAYLSGKVLLILPDDDGFFTTEMRNDLIGMMPSPTIGKVTGGHTATIMKVGEYVSSIRKFLSEI